MRSGNLAREWKGNACLDWLGKRRERSHLEDLGINRRITLISLKEMGLEGVNLSGCKAVTTVGFCEHVNELLNVGGFLKS